MVKYRKINIDILSDLIEFLVKMRLVFYNR